MNQDQLKALGNQLIMVGSFSFLHGLQWGSGQGIYRLKERVILQSLDNIEYRNSSDHLFLKLGRY